MEKTEAEILDGFNQEIVPMIVENYNLNELEAFRKFINSQTYKLLLDKELRMWHMSTIAVYDIWENEYLTGDLTNSFYIRGDEL